VSTSAPSCTKRLIVAKPMPLFWLALRSQMRGYAVVIERRPLTLLIPT
jgi:hypothetical protein